MEFMVTVNDTEFHNFLSKLECRMECEKVIYMSDMAVALANMKPFEYIMEMSNRTYSG